MSNNKKPKVSRDTSNPMNIKSEEEMFALRAEVDNQLLGEMLDTFQGRRAIYRVLASSGLYDDILETGELADRRIGKRSLGLDLLNDVLTARPDVYRLMQQEGDAFNRKYVFTPPNDEREEDG